MAVLQLLAQHVLLSPISRSTWMVGGSSGDLLLLCDMFDGFVAKKSKTWIIGTVLCRRAPRGLREGYKTLCGVDVRRRTATDEVHVTSGIMSGVRGAVARSRQARRDTSTRVEISAIGR